MNEISTDCFIFDDIWEHNTNTFIFKCSHGYGVIEDSKIKFILRADNLFSMGEYFVAERENKYAVIDSTGNPIKIDFNSLLKWEQKQSVIDSLEQIYSNDKPQKQKPREKLKMIFSKRA